VVTQRRYPRDRGVRAFIKRLGSVEPRRWEQHPVYGEIPLIRDPTHGYWRPDPDFRPRLPRRAVRGDVSKQDFCVMHYDPKYFYLDEKRTCSQCGRSFVFRAAEQKFWYETLRFNFNSIPIRCPACRRQRRSEHALREQIARARSEVRSASDNPGAHLALARAVLENHERTGTGNLDEAISAARRAAKIFPETIEPLFWEGLAHELAGRRARAREYLARFVADERAARDYPALLKRARTYLDLS
jgi:tetratricopeptide (TPR) repeat protein